MVTQKELKELFHYCADTGIFTRLTQSSYRVKIGDIAGYLHHDGYRVIKIKGRGYGAHRLAWLYVYGDWPKDQIDHVNHIRDDNRIANLRDVTNRENSKNSLLHKNNTSDVSGVHWDKRSSKWRATIQTAIKSVHLGLFADKFEAICARLSANNKHNYHESHGRIK